VCRYAEEEERERAAAAAEEEKRLAARAEELATAGAYHVLTKCPRVYASSQLFNVSTVASPSSTPACPYHLLTIVHVFTRLISAV
jgi:hypothetical protein